MPKREAVAQYYGSKLEFVDFIYRYLPGGHHTWVDCCCGMGNVTLHKSPSKVEVINDTNLNIPILFETIRDHPMPLARAVALTPYSYAEWDKCRTKLRHGIKDKLERSRCFLVTLRQSRGTSPGEAWSRVVDHSRRDMASSCSRWLNVPDYLIRIADRLRTIQTECLDFQELIEKYARKKTLFYLDPPYLDEERNGSESYGDHEWDRTTHDRMLGCVLANKGMFMISGYASECYERMLTKARGWERFEHKVACRSNVKDDGSTGKRPHRMEVLWVRA